MKSIVLFVFLASLLLKAESLDEILSLITANPQLKTAQQMSRSAAAQYAAQKSANYPSLDLLYSANYLFERPVVYLKVPGASATLQMQSQNQYDGSLRLSYALFSGFSISAGIDAAKFSMQRSRLETEDLKRNLYLGGISAYASAVAAKEFAAAQEKALMAIEKSYEKAKEMNVQGMLRSSALYRIEASLHETKAELTRANNNYLSALNLLSYLASRTISSVKTLPKHHHIDEEELLESALIKRPDLQALRKISSAQKSLVKLKKSGFYPSLSLFAQLARHGDDPMLDGDGYTNKDRSAAGFRLDYNLFGGLKDIHETEAARKELLSAQWRIVAYEALIKKEIKEDYLGFASLKSQLRADESGLKASEAYYELVKSEFDNQLSDADLLSRAIASLAAARSRRSATQARLYAAYAKMLLQVDVQTYQEATQPDQGEVSEK